MASRCARRFALTLSLAATLAAVAVASSRVDAKTFFYAHGVHAEDEPTDIAAEQLLVGESAFHDIGIDDSLAVGGRIGVWFDRVPWLGLALDGSYVAPETSGVEIQVMSLTPMLMLPHAPGSTGSTVTRAVSSQPPGVHTPPPGLWHGKGLPTSQRLPSSVPPRQVPTEEHCTLTA